MLETSARLLELLTLLQVRRDWTAAELAARFGVSTRTVRADVARLRALGYPVEARSGVAGGYRLGQGAALPPLVLDDDEAVAVAAGLRVVAGAGAAGVEETSLRALTKLEQVLPDRLRRRLEAVRVATSVVPGPAPSFDPFVLGAVAAAVRDRERLRFGYTAADGAVAARHVEPHRLVSWDGLWYLLAWDLERDDWRIFRADRIEPRPPTGVRFTPRQPPGGDAVEHVRRSVGVTAWRHRARLRVHAPADVVERLLHRSVVARALDERTCEIEVGADDPDVLAGWLAMLGADIEVLEGTEVAEALGRLAERFGRAASSLPSPGA